VFRVLDHLYTGGVDTGRINAILADLNGCEEKVSI